MPFHVLHMALDLLMSFEPECHLRILVPVVGGLVRVFGKVNVQSFSVLHVIVVCCTKDSDKVGVVCQEVEFRKVESCTNLKINKYLLVVVKQPQGIIERL